MITVFFRKCGDSYNEQHEAAYKLLYAAFSVLYPALTAPNIIKTDKGKPIFEKDIGVYFSIAHTNGAVAVSIGDIQNGVDIERERAIPKRVCDRYLGGAEGHDAVILWTRAEAYVKLTGQGISGLSAIDIDAVFQTFEYLGYTVTVCTGTAHGASDSELIEL